MKKNNLLNLIALAVVLVLVNGCGSVTKEPPKLTPPKDYNVNTKTTFNKKIDEVWGALIEWHGMNNIPIKNMEKVSGYITSEGKIQFVGKYCDCGVLEYSGQVWDYPESIDVVSGNFNIVVRKITGEQTEVTINVFYKLTERTTKGRIVSLASLKCVSTGLLEKNIFDYIQNR